MQRFIAPFIALILLAAPPAWAETVSVSPDEELPRLDQLFDDLKRERNEAAAKRIANFIREEWGRSGSATVDLMMQWSAKAMSEERYDVALDFLDQITVLAPQFAEGWNRRATLHYTMGSYAKSMADIEHVLRLEPRHFGALSGMAAIFKTYDMKEPALEAFRRVLDVYPMLRSAQEEVAELAEELAGEGI
ncbi:MAG: hypothetical protein JJ969_09890 [Rhizobiaceae bacterium]|nr:hypothetical protein [Rhizobiaceae bacterium]MBO6724118.1 hypothetical protein [Rhizobiaceae bacterium]